MHLHHHLGLQSIIYHVYDKFVYTYIYIYIYINYFICMVQCINFYIFFIV